MEDPTIRAVIYTRVSTQGQADKGRGLEGQLERCRKMCKEKDYLIVKEYSDSISGTVQPHDRKSFSQLLEDGKNGVFNTLVVYSFDRLAREIRIFLDIKDKLDAIGIKIVSTKENIDTNSDSGDFMMNIYASIANLELRTIKTRLMMGKEQKRLERGYVGGKLPFGYKVINKEVHLDSDKIDTIKQIFCFRDKLDMSLNKIAKHFNDTNIPTPSGKGKWHSSSINRILDNEEKYKGCILNDNNNGICWPKILD